MDEYIRFETSIAAIVDFAHRWDEMSLMNYHDFNEMRRILSICSRYSCAQLKTIGYSYDYNVDPPHAYPILALRVRSTGPMVGYGDTGDGMPSILFEAGIHGREWLGSESLIELAKYLVENAENEDTIVPWLLERVNVWIIPMSNPAGRVIDDLERGDPRYFYKGPGNVADGWRHNGDTLQCQYGVDVNRNFSVGWRRADANPDNDPDHHYQGVAPFSTTEATALRHFVQNHWICMAVDIHTNGQVIWNRWGDGDIAGSVMRKEAAAVWRNGCRLLAQDIGKSLSDLKLEFVQFDLGGGSGQFTAWLESRQAIQTFMLELPFNNKDLGNYYDGEFQYNSDDRSNSFHPSGGKARSLINKAFIPMALYLIEQAIAPFFASGEWHQVSEPHSHSEDYGILAAKIGTYPGSPGKLESRIARFREEEGRLVVERDAFDYLPPGDNYHVFYWIQNYSGRLPFRIDGACEVTFKVGYRRHLPGRRRWVTESTVKRTYRELGVREKRYDSIPFKVVSERDYVMVLKVHSLRGNEAGSDDFAKNDIKIFRFTTSTD